LYCDHHFSRSRHHVDDQTVENEEPRVVNTLSKN